MCVILIQLHYERALKLRAGEREADGGGNNTVRLLRLASEEFKNSLRCLPDNTIERSRLANVLVQVASRTPDRDEALLNYSKAIEILKSAVSICEAQRERQALGYDRTNSSAIGGMVTLLEAALVTFVRWATPKPLPVLISSWNSNSPRDNQDSSADSAVGGSDSMSSHSDKVTAMYVEASTMTLITGGVDRCVKAWRVLRHNNLFPPSSTESVKSCGHIQPLWSHRSAFEDRVLAVHANSEYVAAASQDRRICVYSLFDGVKVTSLQLDKDHATCVRLTPTHSKNSKGDLQRNKRQFIAFGTAYRKVFVYELFGDTQKEPQLIRSLVFPHTRVIALQFANESGSTWQSPHKKSTTATTAQRDVGSQLNREEALPEAPSRNPRLRRSSFGPSSLRPLLALSHHSSVTSVTVESSGIVHQNITQTFGQEVTRIGGSGGSGNGSGSGGGSGGSYQSNRSHDDSSPFHSQPSNDIDQCLVMGLKDGSVMQWEWTHSRQPKRGLVTPHGLSPQLPTISLLAIPLTGSTSLDTASLIRCTLVVQLFQVVAESGENRQSPSQLLSVVERLARQVEAIEEKEKRTAALKLKVAVSPTTPLSYSQKKNQNKPSESALPGIQTFKVRLEAAMQVEVSDSDALSHMLAEFEQHLHHLLTFPSPSQCNMLELDLVHGQVLCATMKGLNRRVLVKPSTAYRPSLPWPKVEQPFLHSDIEPHIPCYQLKVLPKEQVVFSIGKDRMLRVWDLNSGTAIRCLPSFSSDVPVAASNGVVVSVVGQRKESAIRAWAVWGFE